MAAVLYIASGSKACAALQRKLADEGREIRTFDVNESPELIPELLKLTGGRRIVPVLVDGGRIQIAPDGGDSF